MMLRLLILILLIVAFPASLLANKPPLEGRWKAAYGVQIGKNQLVAERAEGDPYLGRTIRFSAHGIDGPVLFHCHDAQFAWSSMPAESFFQGFAENAEQATVNARLLNLPDPAKTLSINCQTGIFDFHMRDNDTMLIMINWVVYTFERQR